MVDRTAPRFRASKYRYNLINNELYEKFRETHPNIVISWKDFKKINETINETYVEEILANREGAVLPEQMGRVWLGLFPAKERILNEPYVRETGEHATFFSFHSNGMQGKIVWDFSLVKYKVENRHFYGFSAHRSFKTAASKCFISNPELYSRIFSIVAASEAHKNLKNNRDERNRLNNTSGDNTGQNTTQDGERGLASDQ